MLDDGVFTLYQQMEIVTGFYFVKIPRVSDIGLGGPTLATVNLTCRDLSVDITELSVYIDPAPLPLSLPSADG